MPTLHAHASLEILKHLGDLEGNITRAMALLPKDGNVEIFLAMNRAKTAAALARWHFTHAVVGDVEVRPAALAVAAE